MSEAHSGRVAVWIATCGGLGYLPLAPGTAGAVVGLGLVVALARLPLERSGLVASVAGATLALSLLGVWASSRAIKYFGNSDPGPVVIDEVVGQMLTFLVRPDAAWKWLLTGFIFFRVLDVVKPFPARQAEQAPGGWGIVLDDLVAGAYSLGALTLLKWLFK